MAYKQLYTNTKIPSLHTLTQAVLFHYPFFFIAHVQYNTIMATVNASASASADMEFADWIFMGTSPSNAIKFLPTGVKRIARKKIRPKHNILATLPP